MKRRSFLWDVGGGLGGVAMAQMLTRDALGSPKPELNGGIHHPAKVKRVIQLFMTGGASPMDTFDYKPALEKLHGQKLGPKEKPEGFTAMPGALLKSPFEFKQHGESGRWVSSVFPHQAKWVDEMGFLMAMKSKTNVHGPGTYMMNSGFLLPGFPCLGAWTSYALGNLTDNLPTFVVLPDSKGLPYNQRGPFSWLPPGSPSRNRHQGRWLESGAQPFRERALRLCKSNCRAGRTRLASSDERGSRERTCRRHPPGIADSFLRAGGKDAALRT